MSELDDLEKFFPYKHDAPLRPSINDSDLQIELTKGDDLSLGTSKFDFENIYLRYKTEEIKTSDESPIELSDKTMDELEGAYKTMRTIHDQLVEVYKELIKTHDQK